MNQEFYKGQRLSFDGVLCTVQYIGKVEGTKGDWLGIEWDEKRGKHSGEYNGVRYFECKSKRLTPGLFIRPSRPGDKPRGFLEALHQKYASEYEEELAKRQDQSSDPAVPLHDLIQISGKIVEEVGFEKIRKQLAELQQLRIVLLDGLRVSGVLAHNQGLETREEALRRVEKSCPKIVELDLSRNLLWKWTDVHDICKSLKQLRSLKLNGNRFGRVVSGLVYNGISELHLDHTLLSWDEIAQLSYQFPSLTSLAASTNQISIPSSPISQTIRSLILEHNEFATLSSIRNLASLPVLEHLSLRSNDISSVYSPMECRKNNDTPFRFPGTLKSLDIAYNKIDSWSFVNALPDVFPGLSSLRISNNPLYDQPAAPSKVTNRHENPMTVDEAFMLTLGRLSSLTSLNYSKISRQDRANGELYYLSLIGKELSAFPRSEEQAILAQHPQYRALYEIYGEPIIKRVLDTGREPGTVHPRSVAARLLNFTFYLAPALLHQPRSDLMKNEVKMIRKEHMCKIPKTVDTYRIKALVSQLFSLPPLSFRLIWETEEWDPMGNAAKQLPGEDEWDSSSSSGFGDDGDGDKGDVTSKQLSNHPGRKPQDYVPGPGYDANMLIKREVELVDSTRQVGFFFDDNVKDALVRVEPL